MGEDHAETKQALRRRLRAARAELPPRVVAELGDAVCVRVLGLPAFAAARALVAYAPVENEVDPGAVVAAALATGKSIYYPRRTAGDLEFLECGPTGLTPGSSAIPEPRGGRPLATAAGEGVVFLVPGVAFDSRGARLGRGAGCYDRGLARHPHATRVGLAYEMQLVPTLPEAAWDVRMDAVVTEARVLRTVKERSP